jgi:ribosomal-protein-alanine N-acetyltransferase
MGISVETERLLLKNYSENDLESIYKLKSEPLIWKYSTMAVSTDINESRKYLFSLLKNYDDNKYCFQALFLKDTQEYVGEAGILSFYKQDLRAVVGFNLLPEFWKRGYATEITIGLVKFLFEEMKVERIEALVVEENEASRKVLEKSGFIIEGLLRNFACIDQKFVNVCYYGIIKSDYQKVD